jgi:hypothetical protein
MQASLNLVMTAIIAAVAALVAGGVILSVLLFVLWVVHRVSPQGREDALRRAKGKPALYPDIQVRAWSDPKEGSLIDVVKDVVKPPGSGPGPWRAARAARVGGRAAAPTARWCGGGPGR